MVGWRKGASKPGTITGLEIRPEVEISIAEKYLDFNHCMADAAGET